MGKDYTQIFDDKFNEDDEILVNCHLKKKYLTKPFKLGIKSQLTFHSSLHMLELMIFERVNEIHPGAII